MAVADVMSKGASATALAAISARRGVLVRMPMLYDAALSPTYTEGADPVYEYSWSGSNAQAYDPEFQVCRCECVKWQNLESDLLSRYTKQ